MEQSNTQVMTEETDLETARINNSTAYLLNEPFALYKPSIARDGNKWCVLYGPNPMEGVCGFGDTPKLAIQDFNKNWETEKPKEVKG